jgi:hypothetical protein
MYFKFPVFGNLDSEYSLGRPGSLSWSLDILQFYEYASRLKHLFGLFFPQAFAGAIVASEDIS